MLPLPSLSETPHLEHLTHTNDQPCPAEELTLKAFLGDVHDDIAATKAALQTLSDKRQALMDEIAAMDKPIKALEDRCNGLRNVEKEAKALLTPVRRLPPEILYLIFQNTIDHSITKTPVLRTYSQRWGWDFVVPRNPLWTLELVCKRWRREVLASHSLWTTILLVITCHNFIDYKYLRRLGIQLGRTGHHALSVTIYKPEGDSTSNLPAHVPTLLFPFASRIHHLNIIAPSHFLFQLYPLKHSLHALRSLSIHHLSRSPPVILAPGHNGYDLLEDSTLLKTVDLVNINRIYNVDWKLVTSFSASHSSESERSRYNGLSIFSYLHLLWYMKDVERCHIRCEKASVLSDTRFIEEGITSPIISKKLVSLTLTAGSFQLRDGSIGQLLDHIRLPVLQHLDVDCFFSEDEVDRDRTSLVAMCDVVIRSQSPLETLRFHHGYVDIALLQVLRSTPTLVDMRLTDIRDNWDLARHSSVLKQVVTELVVKPDQENVVLPQLRVIRLSGFMIIPADLLGDMVVSRWNNARCAHLEDISIRWPINNMHLDVQRDELMMGPDAEKTCRTLIIRLKREQHQRARVDIGFLPDTVESVF